MMGKKSEVMSNPNIFVIANGLGGAREGFLISDSHGIYYSIT